ncbi:MAG: hypothetical protein E6Q36_01245 [Chryseobacterium sp.]|nr:MAG: hypothetical protein E6Q36_01245 [Chryseobacterium sp.]
MAFTIKASNYAEWEENSLADYGNFSDRVEYCNQGEDAFSGFGEWFFVPDEPLPNGDRVIYFGSWGNDNSPGASTYTNAEIFDALDPEQLVEFSERVDHWESQPEHLETDDCDVEHDLDEPWDHLLAQQELEDFEQADEYFGYFGDGDF